MKEVKMCLQTYPPPDGVKRLELVMLLRIANSLNESAPSIDSH